MKQRNQWSITLVNQMQMDLMQIDIPLNMAEDQCQIMHMKQRMQQ